MDTENENTEENAEENTEENTEEDFELGIRINGDSDDDFNDGLDSAEAQDVASIGLLAGEDSETEEMSEDGDISEDKTDTESALFQKTDTMFSDIKQQLEHLEQEFESKIKYDAHKEKIIDTLHQELQGYREGIVKKHLHAVITDIVKIIDDIRKFAAHYNGQAVSEDNAQKALKFVEGIASDLEDVFGWQGIVPYTCEGNQLDTTRLISGIKFIFFLA